MWRYSPASRSRVHAEPRSSSSAHCTSSSTSTSPRSGAISAVQQMIGASSLTRSSPVTRPTRSSPSCAARRRCASCASIRSGAAKTPRPGLGEELERRVRLAGVRRAEMRDDGLRLDAPGRQADLRLGQARTARSLARSPLRSARPLLAAAAVLPAGGHRAQTFRKRRMRQAGADRADREPDDEDDRGDRRRRPAPRRRSSSSSRPMIAGSASSLPSSSSRIATTEPTTPQIRPSSMNGPRTNQFVAPTSFITSISRRREKIESRIVFAIRSAEETSRTIVATRKAIVEHASDVQDPIGDLLAVLDLLHARPARGCRSDALITFTSAPSRALISNAAGSGLERQVLDELRRLLAHPVERLGLRDERDLASTSRFDSSCAPHGVDLRGRRLLRARVWRAEVDLDEQLLLLRARRSPAPTSRAR